MTCRRVATASTLTLLLVLTAGCTTLEAQRAAEPTQSANAASGQLGGATVWSSDKPTWEGLPSRPVSPEQYAATFMQASPENALTRPLEGILVFYTDAATAFPFPLPDGYSFPVDPGFYDRPEDGPNWSEVMAFNRIWNYWEYANADAARAAHVAGDDATATRYLDVIRDGYLSAAFPNNYVGTPAADWYAGKFGDMREGDYSAWDDFMFNPFPWQPPS